MTREEARKKAEIMMAYADGKDIEFREYGESWDIFKGDDCDNELSFNFNMCEYRIKQEPKYRPFKNKEECWDEMRKHQPFGWVKNTGFLTCLTSIGDTTDFNDAYEVLCFTDGTPFGIKEE